MAWIESHTVLIRHRKVLQLSAALSLEPVQIVGHLHALWHTVLEQQEDGDLTTWPDEAIAAAAHYKGDPNLFVTQLQRLKWLNKKIVHDWLDYAGRYLTNKYRTANPLRLQKIYKKHKVRLQSDSSQTKVGLKSDTLPTLPNQHTKDLKDSTVQPVDNSRKTYMDVPYSPRVQAILDQINGKAEQEVPVQTETDKT